MPHPRRTSTFWHDGGLSARNRELLAIAASIAVSAALGLYAKRFYHGPAAAWARDSAGGVFYVIFWCLVVAMLLPRVSAARIAVGVLVATCILEFLQAWHPPLLEAARSHFIGRTILGSYFDWGDFLYYFVGAAIGWAWLRAIRTIHRP
jgi:Protein of unknown function (DUF2809)